MIDDEKEKEKGKKKKPKTANVKRLLIYKKTLREYLEESVSTQFSLCSVICLVLMLPFHFPVVCWTRLSSNSQILHHTPSL